MSNEIRTPMNAVLGYSQLMLRDPALPPGAKANLNIINRSGEHLLGLINDVLDMSKIEAGRIELNPVTFDPYALLEDLTSMFRMRANSKGLKFDVVHGAESLPYMVADLGKIRQGLIILLSNAVKFTERGSVRLSVSLKQKQHNQLWLAAEVQDTGLGITPEEQSQLFRPFVQTQSGRTSQNGTGLGLALSREYVRMMGGEIELCSNAGAGSVFRFEIPVEQSGASAPAEENANSHVIGLMTGQTVPKILIVDDEKYNRGWLNQLLTDVGFSLREASDGEEAIQVWKEWKPQLILMDVRMPVMDGLAATRRIKSQGGNNETVIIAVTASALEEDRDTILDSGADDFLSKPCRGNELLEKIRSHLALPMCMAKMRVATRANPRTL
jgi:CheY-like chemotaxis protein